MAVRTFCTSVENALKVLQFQLRSLSLVSGQVSRMHTGSPRTASFSVTRAVWGKTQAELEQEKGIPEQPTKERIYNSRRDIRCGPRKLNLVARQIRGLGITEAIKQMEFSPKKAAITVKEVLEETQKAATTSHKLEDKANLWVAESFVGKGRYYKKIRMHARGRFGIEERKYSHYFVVLQEGPKLGKNKRRRLKHMTELEEIRRHPRYIKNSLSWW
ncbi:39S ribosomal protein L22, mitochondrial-like [Actinia tenebrosa]|uniref:Large ribosomal subunit protein uL22m n=1 Tax=Actinia tenebrosa TaxID=6105 RepID=A0A6P8ID38_ACTTE|nr:39S ribosomal protein L22, mitochondrial-like [Actinia tenebrosa]